MAEISAKLVKQLRDKTNAGIMNCKKALTETNGDLEAAEKWLKEKGMSDAAKKSGRETSQGIIAIAVSDDKKVGTLAELKCETDFVARNDGYKEFGVKLASSFSNEDNPTTEIVSEKYGSQVKEAIAKFGENITLGRVAKLTVDGGSIQSYVHGVGNIGVIAAFETGKQDTNQNEDFIGMTVGVAMHIAAMAPDYLKREDVPQNVVDEHKDILSTKAKESGKPDNVIEKMVNGQMSKFYGEITLLEQAYVKDQKKKVKDIISETGKKLGDDISLVGFIRLELGE